MIIEHTLTACDCGIFDAIVLVVSAPYVGQMKEIVERNDYGTKIIVVAGGNSRKESCRRGVEIIKEKNAHVVIHNGVQPFVAKEDFVRCLNGLRRYPAVTSGCPCVYTVLKVGSAGYVEEMPDRATMYSDMGVEGFRLPLLRRVLFDYDDDVSTDIIGMVFRSRFGKVGVVAGNPQNIKITYANDLIVARKILRSLKNGKA